MLTRLRHDLDVKIRAAIQESWTLNKSLFLAQNLVARVRAGMRPPAWGGVDWDQEPRWNLSAMVRVKDEGRFVLEWICHHIGVGVEHFYIYDNASSDDTRARLEPLIRAGRVTYVHWPTVPITPSAEIDFFRRFAKESRWVAFIDSDEFIEMRSSRTLSQILASHPAPALALNWRLFGSSWHAGIPEGMVTKNFEYAGASLTETIKVIVQPREVISLRNPHNFYYRGGRLAMTVDGAKAYGTLADAGKSGEAEAELRHYIVRSIEDDHRKSVRGDAEAAVGYSRFRDPTRAHARYQLYNDVHRPFRDEQLGLTASLMAYSTGTERQLEVLTTSAGDVSSESTLRPIPSLALTTPDESEIMNSDTHESFQQELPFISVILPFFNSGSGLRAATEALSRLDYPRLEFVLVDDGSSDESSNIARAFVDGMPDARLITNTVNLGVAESRNRALRTAKGEYVWFTDSDDEWSPNILTHLGGAVARTNADVAICRAVCVDEHGRMTGYAEEFQGGRILTGQETIDQVVRRSIKGFLWTKLIRRSLIPEDPFPRRDTMTDFCGLVPVLARAQKVALLDEVLYRYVRRTGSLTNRRSRTLSDFDHLRQTMREVASEHYEHGRNGSVHALGFDYHDWHLLKVKAAALNPDRKSARMTARDIASQITFRDLLRLRDPYPDVARRALAVKVLGSLYPDLYLAAMWARRHVLGAVTRSSPGVSLHGRPDEQFELTASPMGISTGTYRQLEGSR